MDFDTAFARLVDAEGGYVNNPADPGGETKYGISKRAYPDVDIANLTVEQAKAIYKRDFWDVLGDTDPAIKFQVFDFAVNSGVGTAIRKLQASVNVADDGHWGPASAAAVRALSVDDVLFRLTAGRLRYLTRCVAWPTMGAGWVNRVAKNLDYAAGDTP